MSIKDAIRNDWDSEIKPLIPVVNSDTLYHYTNTAGLMGMIKNSEIWITERNFMNDISEKITADIFFNDLGITPPSSFESYIFSLSTHKNKSNQWSTYGNNDGYCIEFKTDELLSYLNDEFPGSFISIFGCVIYDDKLKEQIKGKLKRLVKKYGYINVKQLAYNSLLVHSLIKDSSWEFEGEVRYIVHNINNKALNELDFTMEKSFREKNGLITPYISMSRAQKGFIISEPFQKYTQNEITYDQMKNIHSNSKRKLPISKIYIGPKVHDPIAISGLELFLEHHGYENVDVKLTKGKHR